MSALFTTAPLRALEASALAALPPGTLMQRAAAAVADAAAALARSLAPRRPMVALVGPGNNGGDALLAALLLRERGFACGALALRPEDPAGGDAAQAWQRARAQGLRIDGVDALPALLAADPIVIDGLFGIGLDRPLTGDAARLCAAVAQAGLPVVAVDVPSGVDSDTGAIVGGPDAAAIRAACTVTMIADKPGLHTGAALDRVGALSVASLGLDTEREAFARDAGPAVGRLFDAGCARTAWTPRARDSQRNSHKGSFGAVLAYGGAQGMRGAVLLAARGAHALGAGKVFVGAPDGDAFDPAQPQLMSAPSAPDFGGCDAVVIGCGLGRSALARERTAAALAAAPALVVDADALNLVADEPALAARLSPQRRTVLTPHPLEAARLLGCDVATVQADRRGAALALARRFGAVALLKGAGSVVATPQGQWSIVDAGNPALASAGTGDVLAGMVGALLARGAPAADAACLAAWLHGRAGTLYAQAQGHAEGLSAAELPTLVRAVLGEVAERRRNRR